MNIEDRNAIMDLIYEYSYTYDENDIRRFSTLFTEDGVWVSPFGTALSRDEIYELLAPRREKIAKRDIQNRHFQTNTILSSSPDGKVNGKTMVLVTWQFPGEKFARVHLTGYYEDEFVRTTKGWKFSRRALFVDQSPSNLEVGK
jgi:hypothetical protein